MMPLYHLWNPHLRGPRSLRGYLTEADALYTGTGTDALIAAVCAAIGAGPAVGWTWTPVRTPYLAPYRDDPSGWEDAWGLAWQVTIALAADAVLRPVPLAGRFDIDEGDGSARSDAPALTTVRCLVLADARDAEMAAACAAVAAAAGHAVERGQAMSRFPALAIDLGLRDEAFFAAGADEAEAVVAALVAVGASVRAETSQGWMLERSS